MSSELRSGERCDGEVPFAAEGMDVTIGAMVLDPADVIKDSVDGSSDTKIAVVAELERVVGIGLGVVVPSDRLAERWFSSSEGPRRRELTVL